MSSTNRTDDNTASSPDNASSDLQGTPKKESARDAKLQQRRFHWSWNPRLLVLSLAVVVPVLLLSIGSYFYHSSSTADTLLALAKDAEGEENFSDQAKWLRRYSLLAPDDIDAIYQVAVVADRAANSANPKNKYQRVDAARRSISSAIAQLGDRAPEKTTELRKLLIAHLLKLGGPWNREAERQTVILNAPHDDAQSHASMARSLVGQLSDGSYVPRAHDSLEKKNDYWGWLSNQQAGFVVAEALKRNPKDLDLISSFLFISESHPQHFVSRHGGAGVSTNVKKRLIEQSVAFLGENSDSRSSLILYEHLNDSFRRDEATAVVNKAAELAQDRLTSSDVPGNDSAQVESETENPAKMDADNEAETSRLWDCLALLEAAKINQTDNPERAQSFYEILLRPENRSLLQDKQVEVYLGAGNVQATLGNVDSAIDVFEKGLGDVGANDLSLIQAIAQTKLSHGDFDGADTIIVRLEEAIKKATASLSNAPESSLSRSDRIASGRRLDTARWISDVFRGFAAIENGKPFDAIEHLESSVNVDAPVSNSARIIAMAKLAKLYGEQGSWDQAASMFDRTLAMAPDDQQLRLAAADAWVRTGNEDKAIEQWQAIGSGDSPRTSIPVLEGRINHQFTLLPEQRDFESVRFQIDQMEGSLRQLIKNSEASTDEPDAANQKARNENDSNEGTKKSVPNKSVLESEIRYLGALRLTIPSSNEVEARVHLNSPEVIDQLESISEANPDDARLQALLATRFSRTDRRDLAMKALDRLEKITDVSKDATALLRAKVVAALGEPVVAARELLDHAQTMTPMPSELLLNAAGLAARGGDGELAYEALTRMDTDDLSLATMFSIVNIVKQLPDKSTLVSVDGKDVSLAKAKEFWTQKLREREGESGTYWRFLEAEEILLSLSNEKSAIEPNESRLVAAKELVKRILAVRPRWGDAISLEGWIANIQGKPERAISRLQRGIAAGDERLRTRQLLWNQLILLGRNEEAEQEIRSASLAYQVQPVQFTASHIDIAMRQGDFSRSVDIALDSAKQKPADLLAQLVVASTGTTAIANTPNAAERNQLLSKTRAAIERAEELAGKNDIRVLASRLRLALALNDMKLIRAAIKEIEESDADRPAKSRLLGQSYAAIGQLEKSLALFKEVEELEPTANSSEALAKVYRRLKRQEEELDALRVAQKREPSNEKLRNQLAQRLVQLNAKSGDVDWNEIEALLSNSTGAFASNRLVYGILLASEGLRKLREGEQLKFARTQIQKSYDVLKEVVATKSSLSDDAMRYLAMVLHENSVILKRKREDSADGDPVEPSKEQRRFDSAIRNIYQTLEERGRPAVIDLYRYASYLLDQSDDTDDPKIKELLDRMSFSSGSTTKFLELQIRVANRDDDRNSIPTIVEKWATKALEDPTNASLGPLANPEMAGTAEVDRSTKILLAAGMSLLKLDFADKSIQWFERAYAEAPIALQSYVIALNKSRQVEKAINICGEHFSLHQDAVSAKLFLELVLSLKDPEQQANTLAQHNELVDEAIENFEGDALLLESVGTLRMAQGEFESATKIFQRVLKKDPARIRTLNNLSMAFSEIPGRESEGLGPINAAIALSNGNAELLDTKGVVLMASGQVSDAEKTFAEAFASSNEPRHQFHVIVAQLMQGKESQAKENWNRLDLDKLDPTGLTPNERKTLEDMKRKLGKSQSFHQRARPANSAIVSRPPRSIDQVPTSIFDHQSIRQSFDWMPIKVSSLGFV